MSKTIIDSNVFIAFFWEEDPNNETAVSIIEKIKNKEIIPIVPTLFLPEVCGSIQRRTKDSKLSFDIQQRLEKWIREEIIVVYELTKERMRNASKTVIEFGLKGADAIYVDLTKELKGKLLTFDEEIKKKIKDKVEVFE